MAERLERLKAPCLHGAVIKQREHSTDYALRYVIQHDGDTETLARHIEDVEGLKS